MSAKSLRSAACVAVSLILASVAHAAVPTTFTSGDLYTASNTTSGTIYNITGGGNRTGNTPFASGAGANLGDMTWSSDLTTMYSSDYAGDHVYKTTAAGVTSLYANVSGAVGIIRTSTNRLLAASFNNNTVIDITNPASPTVFATGVFNPRNMVQLPNGKILAAGADANNHPVIYDITTGGAASTYATLPGTAGYAGDIDYTSTGKVYASTAFGNSVYEITGGVVAPTPFATVAAGDTIFAFGLAIDRRTDKILLAPLSQTYVWDITAGGAFSSTSPKYAFNIPTTNDMALQFVPFVPEPATLAVVPLLGLLTARRRNVARNAE